MKNFHIKKHQRFFGETIENTKVLVHRGKKELRKILLEIIELLEFVGETGWIITLKRLYADNVSSPKDWLREIKGLFGGMESFTDLVLMRNGIICIDENNRLDQLRDRLYNRMVQFFVELNNSEKSL